MAERPGLPDDRLGRESLGLPAKICFGIGVGIGNVPSSAAWPISETEAGLWCVDDDDLVDSVLDRADRPRKILLTVMEGVERDAHAKTIAQSPCRVVAFRVDLHPQTGSHYAVVMPATGAFTDIHACYSSLEVPWLSVLTPGDFPQMLRDRRGDNVIFVHWAPATIIAEDLPSDRRASVFPVYSEAIDEDRSLMLPDHQRDLARFLEIAVFIDGVFAHTPWMAKHLAKFTGKPGFVLPVGWGPIMGAPEWEREKEVQSVFAGSMVGRRCTIIPELEGRVGLEFCHGLYGSLLLDRMNASKTTLYIAHSKVHSYSTWRIWQALCSSSALVTERGDWWPLDEDLCIPIDCIDDIPRTILDLSADDALTRARALHDGLRHFTTRFCVETYIVEQLGNRIVAS